MPNDTPDRATVAPGCVSCPPFWKPSPISTRRRLFAANRLLRAHLRGALANPPIEPSRTSAHASCCLTDGNIAPRCLLCFDRTLGDQGPSYVYRDEPLSALPKSPKQPSSTSGSPPTVISTRCQLCSVSPSQRSERTTHHRRKERPLIARGETLAKTTRSAECQNAEVPRLPTSRKQLCATYGGLDRCHFARRSCQGYRHP